MAISPGAIQDYLAKSIVTPPVVKDVPKEELLRRIWRLTGEWPQFKSEPREAQIEALAFGCELGQFLLAYDMRLGKAMQMDTPVATPNGWIAIKNLKMGDAVFGPDGLPTEVLGVYPQGKRTMHMVTFSDGATTVCDGQHLWQVNTAVRRGRGYPPRVYTLDQIIADGLIDKTTKGCRHYIPLIEPIQYSQKHYNIDPYLMGVILGDGSVWSGTPSITTDLEIIESLTLPAGCSTHVVPHKSSEGIVCASIKGFDRVNLLTNVLKSYGLYGHVANGKFIPKDYLVGSVEQRLALLSGLLDTDGWNQGSGQYNTVCWGSVSEQLAFDMQELVRSLGGTASMTQKKPKYTYKGEKLAGQNFYCITVRLPQSIGCPFRFSRKRNEWKPFKKFQAVRGIVATEIIGEDDAVCIKVARPDGLFVVEHFIVTHNTKASLDWAQHMALSGVWDEGKGLVIVPSPVLVDVWETQAVQHSHLNVVGVLEPTHEALERAVNGDADLIVISITTLQALFTIKKRNEKRGRNEQVADKMGLAEFASCFRLAIFDEIHVYQNPLGLYFDIARLATEECYLRCGLTGTPIGNNPTMVWGQAYLVDRGKCLGRNFFFFKAAFEITKESWTGKDGKKVKTMEFCDTLLPTLLHKLSAITLSRKRHELYDTVTYSGVQLKLHGDQAAAYQDVLKKVIEINTGNRLAIENNFVKLRQVSSGYLPFTDEDGNKQVIKFKNNAKLDWLKEFVQEAIGLRCVVFHEFTMTGELITNMLREMGVACGWLHGDTKDKPSVICGFQKGDFNILVQNTGTGSMGTDLSIADYELFYETPLRQVVRAQAEARAMGESRGHRPLFIDDLVCSTVETKLITMIREGKDVMNAIYLDPKVLL